jgi:hypothetical protein
MGKNDLFLAFYRHVNAICAVQRLQKPLFCLFLPVILDSIPMDISARSSFINSVGELTGIRHRLFSNGDAAARVALRLST